MRRKKQQRGSAMVEFATAGIASTIMLISTFQLAMIMWNYHTMAFVVHEATRFVAVRGVGCTKPGNTCSVNVGTIAHRIDYLGIGIPSGRVNVTLTTDSGAQTLCAPLSSCFSNTTVWPPSSNNDNKTGSLVTISANYQFQSALLFFWPGVGTQNFGAIGLPASSTQSVVF
jgi:hypothetical protein